MLKYTFSAKCIQMVDLAISLSDHHSSIVIDSGLLLCPIASIWHLMINTSYIISFQRAKILPLNFLISQHVFDVEAIVLLEVFVVLVISFKFLLLVLMLFKF